MISTNSFAWQECFFSFAMEEITVKCHPVCSVEPVVFKNWCYLIVRMVLGYHFTQIYYLLPRLLNLCVRNSAYKLTRRQKYSDLLVMVKVFMVLRREKRRKVDA